MGHVVRVGVRSHDRASSTDTQRMRANRGGKIDGRVSVVSSQEAVKYARQVLKFADDTATRVNVPSLR